MDLGEMVCGCVDWIALAQDKDQWRALVDAVMILQVAKKIYGMSLRGCTTGGPSISDRLQ
jgi:hypothetical protein